VSAIFPRSMTALFFAVALSACSSTGHTGGGDPPPAAQSEKHPKPAETQQPLADTKIPDEAKNSSISPEEVRGPVSLPDARSNAEDSIYFSSGKARIDDRGARLLRQHADRLKANPRQVVTLVAFTDNVGSRSYNLAIAEERMVAVAEALRALGVAKSQIRRESAGHSKMSAACSTPACRQQRRRVELIYK